MVWSSQTLERQAFLHFLFVVFICYTLDFLTECLSSLTSYVLEVRSKVVKTWCVVNILTLKYQNHIVILVFLTFPQKNIKKPSAY